jgi:hypothetical protein
VGAGATSAFGSGARLGLVIASGTLTGAVVSAFGVGAVLRPVRAGGALLGEIGPITRRPRSLTLRSTRQRIGPLTPTTDDTA